MFFQYIYKKTWNVLQVFFIIRSGKITNMKRGKTRFRESEIFNSRHTGSRNLKFSWIKDWIKYQKKTNIKSKVFRKMLWFYNKHTVSWGSQAFLLNILKPSMEVTWQIWLTYFILKNNTKHSKNLRWEMWGPKFS